MLDKKANLQNRERLRGLSGVIISTLIMAFGVIIPVLTQAQLLETSGVARTITVADPEVSYGDVILYDVETNLYRLSQVGNDPRFYGVAVENPTLVLEMEDSRVPVVERGLVPVNVTLENGEITVGDPITTSSVVRGKATLALEDQIHIFGFAAEGLSQDGSVMVEGSEVAMGTILVEVGGERLQAYKAALEVESNAPAREVEVEEVSDSEGEREVDPGLVMRFGFASLVALGAIFVIFFAFLSSIKQGVISVGRNPRAQSAIRSMVVLNVILAIVVTAAAIFFAISLLVVGD